MKKCNVTPNGFEYCDCQYYWEILEFTDLTMQVNSVFLNKDRATNFFRFVCCLGFLKGNYKLEMFVIFLECYCAT